jgi:hypothetical protein
MDFGPISGQFSPGPVVLAKLTKVEHPVFLDRFVPTKSSKLRKPSS